MWNQYVGQNNMKRFTLKSTLFLYAHEQIPNSHIAMNVYVYLEAFVKLEKRLCEAQGAATRGQPSIQEHRSKLDRFIRTLASMDITVSGQQLDHYTNTLLMYHTVQSTL